MPLDVGGLSLKAAQRLVKALPFDDLLNRRAAVSGTHVGVERDLPHRHQKDHVPLLAGVLLRDLQLDGLAGMPKRGEERRDRFTHLKVDRTVLHLNDDVRLELAVEGTEVIVARAGAIGFEVVPVQMVVVDEAAIKNDAVMRLQGSRKHVGSLRRGASILRRAGAALGVGLDHEAAEVRNQPVDLIGLLLPPRRNPRIERVEGRQVADDFGTRKIDRQRHANAPGTQRVGDARQFAEHLRLQGA